MIRIQALNENYVISEAQKCLFCYDAPCSKACPNKSKPSEFLRSIALDNIDGAKQQVRLSKITTSCVDGCTEKYCEKACLKGKIGDPIRVHAVHKYLAQQVEKEDE